MLNKLSDEAHTWILEIRNAWFIFTGVQIPLFATYQCRTIYDLGPAHTIDAVKITKARDQAEAEAKLDRVMKAVREDRLARLHLVRLPIDNGDGRIAHMSALANANIRLIGTFRYSPAIPDEDALSAFFEDLFGPHVDERVRDARHAYKQAGIDFHAAKLKYWKSAEAYTEMEHKIHEVEGLSRSSENEEAVS